MDISRELEPADILVSYSQAANKFLEILINITTTNKRSTSRANIKKRQAFFRILTYAPRLNAVDKDEYASLNWENNAGYVPNATSECYLGKHEYVSECFSEDEIFEILITKTFMEHHYEYEKNLYNTDEISDYHEKYVKLNSLFKLGGGNLHDHIIKEREKEEPETVSKSILLLCIAGFFSSLVSTTISPSIFIDSRDAYRQYVTYVLDMTRKAFFKCGDEKQIVSNCISLVIKFNLYWNEYTLSRPCYEYHPLRSSLTPFEATEELSHALILQAVTSTKSIIKLKLYDRLSWELRRGNIKKVDAKRLSDDLEKLNTKSTQRLFLNMHSISPMLYNGRSLSVYYTPYLFESGHPQNERAKDMNNMFTKIEEREVREAAEKLDKLQKLQEVFKVHINTMIETGEEYFGD